MYCIALFAILLTLFPIVWVLNLALRNQREARVEQLRHVEEEVAQCGARLREVERRITCALEETDQVAVAIAGDDHPRFHDHAGPWSFPVTHGCISHPVKAGGSLS